MLRNYFTSALPRTLGVFFFAICLMVSTSCKKDKISYEIINYDGANLAAPSLAAGTYQGAAKFPANLLTEYEGAKLKEIDFYIRNLPTSCKVKVYKKSDLSMEMVYEQSVENVSADSWNTHTLTTPVTVDTDDLWLAIEYTGDGAILGCDPGPAATNGDWFYDNSVGTWNPLVSVYPGININWNIRGKLEITE